MQISRRRIVLLTSVSLSAIATPAFAQVSVEPAMSHVDASEGSEDLLTICLADDSCVFGVEAEGAGMVGAIVNDPATGRIEQIGLSPAGDVDLAIENAGDAQIAAHAVASETGGLAQASALVINGVYQSGAAPGDVALDLSNFGELLIDAGANAHGEEAGAARATASVQNAIHQFAFSSEGGASIGLSNEGSLEVAAIATATEGVGGTTTFAFGGAALAHANGIVQIAMATGGDATLSAVNSGLISLTANAIAEGDPSANAQAIASGALIQSGIGVSVFETMTNTGTVAVAADAHAIADSAVAMASALNGIEQQASGSTATQLVVNDGTISLSADALADVAGGGFAQAIADGGIFQNGVAEQVSQSITNEGTLNLAAGATLTNAIQGSAVAVAAEGMVQLASASTADQALDNSGLVSLDANANASVAGIAVAQAQALAPMVQQATATSAAQTMTNSGTVSAIANANAVATGTLTGEPGEEEDFGRAYASATAFGAVQAASGMLAAQSITNSGTINVEAEALADAPSSGGAAQPFALAIGVRQLNQASSTATQAFTNSGTVDVHALASAAGEGGSAIASAVGLQAFAEGAPLTVAIVNSGVISANATAVAPGRAYLQARGIYVNNAPAPEGAVSVAGTLTNSGSIDVIAVGSGQMFTSVVGTGTTATTISWGGSSAFATGILVFGGANNMTITNSGTISVDAVAADGGTAIALGIGALSNGEVETSEDDVLTINNSGDIIVRQSTDGGETWRRGEAIDVAGNPDNNVRPAANKSVINLLKGRIYGTIAVQAGDDIDVRTGTTYFDGIVNPRSVPAGGFNGLHLDTGISGQGALNILAGGNLILADPRLTGDPHMYDGPAYAIVDTLNVGGDGTLTYELQPSAGGTQLAGNYAQVFANTANLDGTLIADITTGNGLFADSYFWNNVIDANARDGTFNACLTGAPSDASPLLKLDCTYDANANVDLSLTRLAFDAVHGLTGNQLAIAGAIENIYDIDLTGPFGELVAELFLLNEGNLVDAYDQLSGVEYPNYLHAVRNNSFVLNNVVSDQIDCAVHFGGTDQCRDPEPGGRIWVKGTYNNAEIDGSDDLVGHDASNRSAMIGGDYQIGNFKLGALAGYRDISVDFSDALAGSSIDAHGWQLGLYGAYDIGSFYVRSIGSYSGLRADSQRRISIGRVDATLEGQPDVNIWSLYGEAGARFEIGSSWLTPFVAVDHTSMKLKGFSEIGDPGAGLAIDSQTESQTSGLVGLKWAGTFGGITPEAKIAYRHDWGDDLGVDLRFADAPDGSDFRTTEAYKKGSAVAGLSLAGAFGANLTGRLGYQGSFNSEVTDHAVYGSLTFTFGTATRQPRPSPNLPRSRPARTDH